ncbi:MAG: hypothetical protein AAF438_12110 [Pseudomonadota bacterium]
MKLFLPLASFAAFTLGVSLTLVATDMPKPALLQKEDIAGNIFTRPDMYKSVEDGNTTLDVTSLMSSDGKFASGMYRSGATREVIDEPYGVDEFM